MYKRQVVTGNAESISAENWQGKSYSAANKVNIADYFEENTQYHLSLIHI